MAFYNNKREEPVPSVDCDTWECVSESCNGWMRKNFATGEAPKCPLCNSDMQSGSRLITPLSNNGPHLKKGEDKDK